MTLLISAPQLHERRTIAHNQLAALAVGLRRELNPFLASLPEVPREKALLSRSGGRCTMDGSLLRFDPFDPRHICSVCSREYAGGLHDRFRLYWYQLWLAERVLHAAVLGVLTDDVECVAAAAAMLDRQADQYLRFPNADNVLGPSRPFFSTYLESIWLLQLSIALDVLEIGAPSAEITSLGARVRDRLIAPSAALIASYDEGMSNRQVWNNAALMAAARLLDDRVRFDRALRSNSGLHGHLGTALLSDGSWYEGENYHLFAHRGLWYSVQLAATAGYELPANLAHRYEAGFVAPFRTILPDLTYPSRRDSQYAVSIRQPRFAESCELGLAHHEDDRLLGILARLYDPSVPRGETGRAASSADVERNLPATGLSREDLSWRALLCARPSLPPLTLEPLASDLLPAQGLGVIRREEGAVYVSLDYGHSGGGHGHPDRLNLTLVDGARRWFDDPGTGSYVDPTLRWYRSTLAHNAPLLDGHSQPRVHGSLLAFRDGGGAGIVSAQTELAPGLMLRRSVVVMDDYLVDELVWEGWAPHEISLPLHGVTLPDDLQQEVAPLVGGSGAEDGFSFLSDTARALTADREMIELTGARADGARLDGWLLMPAHTEVWSATAPPPPIATARVPLVLARRTDTSGAFVVVWSWRGAVSGVSREGDTVVVRLQDGVRHRHTSAEREWLVDRGDGAAPLAVELAGDLSSVFDDAPDVHRISPAYVRAIPAATAMPATIELGEPHYRRSEFTWQGAGAPHATVTVTRPTHGTVQVEVDVPSSQRLFVPLTTENQLDNEPASINGDSIQLYAISGSRTAGLLLVPEPSSVSARRVDGWTNDLSVDAKWRPTSEGYRLTATIYIDARTTEIAIDVLVNEVVPGRARRRGQLVMSGAEGEFVYLRGDRQDPSRLRRFSLPNV